MSCDNDECHVRFVKDLAFIHHKCLFLLSELCSGVLCGCYALSYMLAGMLSIGSLISCWYFFNHGDTPLQNKFFCAFLLLLVSRRKYYLCFNIDLPPFSTVQLHPVPHRLIFSSCTMLSHSIESKRWMQAILCR